MPINNLPHIDFSITSGKILPFCTLLQHGVIMPSKTGISVEKFLQNISVFSQEYIKSELETIFLDGEPLDELETEFNKPHHTLALSAIMPGLAGAIMRKNSIHAPLRSKSSAMITSAKSENCLIRLKIFNRIAQECGKSILADSVIFPCKPLLKTFAQRPNLLHSIDKISHANNQINDDELIIILNNFDHIHLTAREKK
ncbi:MAG: hypothetical protein OCC45_07580 [Desulfotalea sp.]